MSEFWSACLSRFEKELPAQQYNTWIKTLRLEDDTDRASASPTNLRLIAPNRFVLQWVRERYLEQIETLSRQFFPEPVTISLGLGEPPPAIAASQRPAESVPTPAKGNARPAPADNAYEKARLNPDFTFDTLVTGRANDLARAAAQ